MPILQTEIKPGQTFNRFHIYSGIRSRLWLSICMGTILSGNPFKHFFAQVVPLWSTYKNVSLCLLIKRVFLNDIQNCIYSLNALNNSACQMHTCKCTLSSYFKSYWNIALKVIIGLCEDQVKIEAEIH